MTEPPRIAELRLDADPVAWERAGFALAGDQLVVGAVPVRLGEATGWTLAGVSSTELDGLASEITASVEPAPAAAPHPLGASRIDHIVVLTPSLERTSDAFERAGIRCRRVREDGGPSGDLRQAFFRLGEVIVEAVETGDEEGPARFWGITFAVADLDAAVASLGSGCAPVRDAVQPGRRIAPLRREAGLGLPVALISD